MLQSATLESPGLLEALPDAVVIVQTDGRIAYVNRQVERVFGYGRGELLERPVEMLVPEDARASHPMHRARYLADFSNRALSCGNRLRGRRRDGTEFPAEIWLTPVGIDNKLMIAAVVRDVTDRQDAADARALLASIVESSHEAIMSKTLLGVVTSWNAAAERIYGYSAKEMIGEHIFKLIPPERHAEERRVLEQILNGERVRSYRTTRLAKGGRTIYVSVNVSPVIDRTGAIAGIASVSQDLSDTELAQTKFEGLLEAAPDAIVGVGRDGRIVLANAQAERLLGWAREDLIGQPVEVLVPESASGEHPTFRDRYFADPRPRPMGRGAQLVARRKDGTEFPAEISLGALETEGGLVVSASIRDVTQRLEEQAERERLRAQAERERLEAQLQQAQRLESLGQLAGGVAHDFNNLLAVILNYTDFIADELTGAVEAGEVERWAAARQDVEQVRRAASRATELTHQLLTFGRREVVRPQVLNLNEIVDSVRQLLRRTIGEHVRLTVTLRPDLWAVRADAGQLEQVLLNLAVNARQAMPSGGVLAIETDNAVIDDEYSIRQPGLRPGRYARLRVGDTGVGMPREVVDHAFEPFFTTKPKGEGTGLGLATVYGIVTQAGGSAHIGSEPGVGTSITILLPATDEAPQQEERPTMAIRSGGGETVLLVEDEDAMREVTRRILERHGYQVLAAENGPTAIRLAAEHRGEVELLLTDVVMPGMLGKEVAERISELRPGIRVLFMSGYARPVLSDQGTLDPGVTLVSKPFSQAMLATAVREALEGSASPE